MYHLPENDLLSVATPPNTYTVEEYLLLCDKFGAWFELHKGQISWRFNGEILPDSTLQILLTTNEHQLLKDYTMATEKHDRLVSNIHICLHTTIYNKPFKVYTQAPNIYIALTGSYRVPDAAVTPTKTMRNAL
jgi:hypothetical protein